MPFGASTKPTNTMYQIWTDNYEELQAMYEWSDPTETDEEEEAE